MGMERRDCMEGMTEEELKDYREYEYDLVLKVKADLRKAAQTSANGWPSGYSRLLQTIIVFLRVWTRGLVMHLLGIMLFISLLWVSQTALWLALGALVQPYKYVPLLIGGGVLVLTGQGVYSQLLAAKAKFEEQTIKKMQALLKKEYQSAVRKASAKVNEANELVNKKLDEIQKRLEEGTGQAANIILSQIHQFNLDLEKKKSDTEMGQGQGQTGQSKNKESAKEKQSAKKEKEALEKKIEEALKAVKELRELVNNKGQKSEILNKLTIVGEKVQSVNSLALASKGKLDEAMQEVFSQQRKLNQTFFKSFSSEQMFVVTFVVILWLALYMAFILIGVTSFLSRANLSSTVVSGVMMLGSGIKSLSEGKTEGLNISKSASDAVGGLESFAKWAEEAPGEMVDQGLAKVEGAMDGAINQVDRRATQAMSAVGRRF